MIPAYRNRRALLDVATRLGTSVPRLVQDAVRLAHDPDVYARHPRACRVIVERQERSRFARSLSVRSEV